MPLSKLCRSIVDCEHKTAPKSADGTGYPLIRTSDIGRGRLDLANAHRVDSAAYEEWTRRAVPQPGDLILAREAPVGNVAIVLPDMEPVLGQRTVLIRPNEELVDARYLTYRLLCSDIQYWMSAVANGATVPHLNVEDIRSLPVPSLPPLAKQQEIGATLSAFDDLMENNQRRIRILEETLQLLYLEWFVRFRFPGHEGTELVDSELGPIPDGWQVRSFAQVADFVNGFAFKPVHWLDEGLPIVKIKELKNGISAETPRYDGHDIKKKFFVSDGSVLFSWSADLDVYIWSSGPALLNQHLFDVRPREVSTVYVYLALKHRMPEFRLRAQGTTMRHIKRSALDEVQLVVAPEPVREAFEIRAGPVLELHLNLHHQVQFLERARSLLLPRLMSGELDVSGLHSELEAAGV